jgi:hypothetical protein
MRHVFTLIFSLLICVQRTEAQAPQFAAIGPAVKASIGLTYLNFDLAPSTRVGLRGLESEVSVDLSPRFGAAIELGYLRASNVLRSRHHSDILSYVAGPVWYPIRRRDFQIYVHGLVGLARVTGPVPVGDSGFAYGYVNKLSWELGAGAEVRVHGPIYMRIGADYLHSNYFNSLLKIRGQHNLKMTASVEYVFGSHRKR